MSNLSMVKARVARGIAWLAFVPALAVCTADGPLTSAESEVEDALRRRGNIASVSVNPGNATAAVGLTMQFTAAAKDPSGNEIALTGVLSSLFVTWSSSDPSVATVSSSGAAKAIAPGTATITAEIRGVTGTATATVTAAPSPPPAAVMNLSVTSTTTTSATLSFTAVDDGSGHAASYDVRYAVSPITWGAATSVASGSCATPVAGAAIGQAVVCSVLGLAPNTPYNFQVIAFRGTLNQGATYGPLSNVAAATTPATTPPPPPTPVVTSVSVSPLSASIQVGGTQALVATARDQNGNVMTGLPVSWTSGSPSVASVSTAGVATGVAAGTATINATVSGVVGGSAITVTAAAPPPPPPPPPAPSPVVTTVTVSPATASISVGGTQPLTATVKDQNGSPMSGQTVTWSSSNTGAATVNGSGVVSGVAGGSATITATSAGKTGSATITVTAPPPPPPPPTPVVTTVAVSPTSASLTIGGTQSLSATVKDQNGNTMAGQTVTWSSSNTGIATVSAGGVVTAVAAGSATVTATSSGKTGTASITVTAPVPVPTTVTVTPSSASVAVGATVSLAATVKDQNGNTMAGQTVTWSTSNSARATVNASGVVTGVSTGSATITATSSGKTGTATITVTAAPPVPTTVTVAPSTASVVAGATQSFTATVKDQNGATMTGQTVTWSSNGTAVATVNGSGVATGVAAGSATITATSSGKTGTATLTVTAPPPTPVVTTVTLSPTSASIQVGATQALTATVKDQNGNTMAGQTVTWSSNNTAVATVNGSGLVSGAAAGTATITGTSAGKSGTAMITVTAPPPPPPPGGGTLLFQENFENASMSSRGWYDNTNPSLSTAEHIAGSVSSLQFRWAPGASTPTNGGSMRHKFTASNSFYLSYYVKYSANWIGSGQSYHPHEFHALSNLDDDWTGPADTYMTLYIEQNYQNGGRPMVGFQDNRSINTSMGSLPRNLVGITENRSVTGCNGVVESNIHSECFAFSTSSGYYNFKSLNGPVVFSPTPGAAGYKGNWNYVEAYFQMNTVVNGIGQANGVIQYWFNGQLVLDRHDILFRTGARPTLMFDKFVIAPYIGDGSPVDQTMWIDNIRVATARIP